MHGWHLKLNAKPIELKLISKYVIPFLVVIQVDEYVDRSIHKTLINLQQIKDYIYVRTYPKDM